MRYLAASILIALAAAVYGLFSHGVYSYFMTYAFMIPLIAGALPHLVLAMRSADPGAAGAHETDADTEAEAQASKWKTLDIREAQLAVIATLTAGSILKGVLDIYGTTNRLLIAYPVIAAVLLAITAALVLKQVGNIRGILKNK
jgi:hypothetical protein